MLAPRSNICACVCLLSLSNLALFTPDLDRAPHARSCSHSMWWVFVREPQGSNMMRKQRETWPNDPNHLSYVVWGENICNLCCQSQTHHTVQRFKKLVVVCQRRQYAGSRNLEKAFSWLLCGKHFRYAVFPERKPTTRPVRSYLARRLRDSRARVEASRNFFTWCFSHPRLRSEALR